MGYFSTDYYVDGKNHILNSPFYYFLFTNRTEERDVIKRKNLHTRVMYAGSLGGLSSDYFLSVDDVNSLL